MADTLTSVYKLTKIEVGASDNTWGTKLNATMDKLETLFLSAFTDGDETSLGKVAPEALPDTLPTLTISASATNLYFKETGQSGEDGKFRFFGDAANFSLEKSLTSDYSTKEKVFQAIPSTHVLYLPTYNLQVDQDATFKGDTLFEGMTQYTATGIMASFGSSTPGTTMDVTNTKRGPNEQVRFRMSGAGIGGTLSLVLSSYDSEYLEINPKNNSILASTNLLSILSRTHIPELDIWSDSNRTIHFYNTAGSERARIFNLAGTKSLTIQNGDVTSRIEIHENGNLNFLGDVHTQDDIVWVNGSDAEIARLYYNSDSIYLRNRTGSTTNSSMQLGDDGAITFVGVINGDAGGLTAIPSAGLPQSPSTAERTRILAHVAAASQTPIGAHNLMVWTGSKPVNPGDIKTASGSNLFYSNIEGDVGPAATNGTTWMCCGHLPSGGGDATLFKRTE